MINTEFRHVEKADYDEISHNFSAVAGKSGVRPTNVWLSDDLCLMEYREPGAWPRIGLTRLDNAELVCSWSFISDILLKMFPGKAFIEAYPPKDWIVNTGNSRWFWIPENFDSGPMNLHQMREQVLQEQARRFRESKE